MNRINKLVINKLGWYRWLCSTVGRTPVFGRRTDSVLRSACSLRVSIVVERYDLTDIKRRLLLLLLLLVVVNH